MYKNNLSCQAGTSTRSVVCTAQHHGSKIEGSPETLQTSLHYGIEGLSGIPKLGPTMLRDANHSASIVKFSPGWKFLEKCPTSLVSLRLHTTRAGEKT